MNAECPLTGGFTCFYDCTIYVDIKVKVLYHIQDTIYLHRNSMEYEAITSKSFMHDY